MERVASEVVKCGMLRVGNTATGECVSKSDALGMLSWLAKYLDATLGCISSELG